MTESDHQREQTEAGGGARRRPCLGRIVGWVRRRPYLAGTIGALTAAAVVALAVAWFRGPPSPRAELDRAEGELHTGDAAAALSRLEHLNDADLAPEDRERRRQRLEQAAYAAARTELERGDFRKLLDIEQRAAAHGAVSGRLVNLKLQAERGSRAETTAAAAWTLPAFGYDLGGAAADKKPSAVDEQSERLNQQWEKAVKQYPREVPLLVNYGRFLLTLGRLDAARQRFLEALAAQPGDTDAEVGLGLIACEKGDSDAALTQFRKVLTHDPNSVPAILNAAICLEHLKRFDEARLYRQRVLDLTEDADLQRQIEEHKSK